MSKRIVPEVTTEHMAAAERVLSPLVSNERGTLQRRIALAIAYAEHRGAESAKAPRPIVHINPHCRCGCSFSFPAESAKAEAQPAGTGWVSVEERLPEQGDWCWLVWRGVVQEQPWEWREDYSGIYWRHDDMSLRVREGVTHWVALALPAPPKVTP